MDPEQRLLIILKYLAVKLEILFLGAFGRIPCPKGIRLVDKLGTLFDLKTLLALYLLGSVLFLFYRGMDLFDYDIIVSLILEVDGLGSIVIFLGKVDLGRHEAAVLLENLPCLVLIAELKAVLVYKKSDRGSDLRLVAVLNAV